jgi:hypothetical protein
LRANVPAACEPLRGAERGGRAAASVAVTLALVLATMAQTPRPQPTPKWTWRISQIWDTLDNGISVNHHVVVDDTGAGGWLQIGISSGPHAGPMSSCHGKMHLRRDEVRALAAAVHALEETRAQDKSFSPPPFTKHTVTMSVTHRTDRQGAPLDLRALDPTWSILDPRLRRAVPILSRYGCP